MSAAPIDYAQLAAIMQNAGSGLQGGHWSANLARALSGGLGSYFGVKAGQQKGQQEGAARQALIDAMSANPNLTPEQVSTMGSAMESGASYADLAQVMGLGGAGSRPGRLDQVFNPKTGRTEYRQAKEGDVVGFSNYGRVGGPGPAALSKAPRFGAAEEAGALEDEGEGGLLANAGSQDLAGASPSPAIGRKVLETNRPADADQVQKGGTLAMPAPGQGDAADRDARRVLGGRLLLDPVSLASRGMDSLRQVGEYFTNTDTDLETDDLGYPDLGSIPDGADKTMTINGKKVKVRRVGDSFVRVME